MARNRIDRTFDYDLRLKDSGSVTADAAAQVGGVAKILDLGDGRMDGTVVVDITAIEVASNNEEYIIQAQFSDVFDFDTGSQVIVIGTALHVGALELTKATADTAVGRYELPCTNEINGTVYRYMRLWTEVRGTIDTTGITYSANLHRAA
jgi:hypothetical protein